MFLCLFIVHSFEKMLLKNKAASFEYAKQEYSPSGILLLYSYDWNSCYGSCKSKAMCLQSHQLKRIGFPCCGWGDFLGFLSSTETLAGEGYFNKCLHWSFILEYTIKNRREKNTRFQTPFRRNSRNLGSRGKQIPPNSPKFSPVFLSPLVLGNFHPQPWKTFLVTHTKV